MKRAKKIIAVFLSVLLLISCLTATVFAAETNTQDGLTAVIQTDKENYSVNEEIHITVTVTNNNSFEVKNISIESFLPDTLTLKDGDLKSKTVDLQTGETLTLACVAILEKEEQSSSENETSESTTEETTTEITETTETATETTEPITDETSTTPDTTTSETEPDDILPIEPSTNESNPDATTESVSQENNPTSPDTGDNSPFVKVLIALIIAMAIIAAYIIITKKNNKKATKVISLVLCGAIAVSSFATIGFIKVGAEESNTQNFTVDKTIMVDGEIYTLSANVNYNIPENMIKLYSDPKELNTSDIPQNVLFYIDTENTVTDCEVTLIDADGDKKVADMQDNGKNGDKTAGDGIYSATVSIDCSKEKNIQYYAVIGDGSVTVKSKIREINILTPLTDEEVKDMSIVDKRLTILTESPEYINATDETKFELLKKELDNMLNLGLILSYQSSCDSLEFTYTYPNGINAFWFVNSDTIHEYDALDSALLNQKTVNRSTKTIRQSIVSYLPDEILFIYGYDNDPNSEYYNHYIQAANNIISEGISATVKFLPSVAEMRTLLTDKNYKYIVMNYHGITHHLVGFYTHTTLITQEIATEELDKLYSNDISLFNSRIKKINGKYALTPEFFSFYYEDKMQGTIIDMQSCSSLGENDNWYYGYSSAFLDDCRVSTFIGYHNSVLESYAYRITADILNNMLFEAKLNIGDAFSKALDIWQKNDVEYLQKFSDWSSQDIKDKEENYGAAYPVLMGSSQTALNNAGKITGTIKAKGNLSISGEITVPDATIEITNAISLPGRPQQTQKYKSNGNGVFNISIEPGVYDITISKLGYETLELEDITVTEQKITDLGDVYLKSISEEPPVEPGIPSTAIEFNGHYYQVYDTPMTWDEAKAYCESLDGHLVTITSGAEQEFVESLIANGKKKSYWLGGTDIANEGTWEWITGEKFDYTNWREFMPDNWQNEDYLMMYKEMDPSYTGETFGRWNDLKSDGTCPGNSYFSKDIFGFICEWDTDVKPTGTCITKMEIVDHGQYTGNQGDSRVFHLDKSGLSGNDNRYYRNGNIGLDGTEYNDGLEVWIARWNFTEEVSWAYATYKLDGKYTRLTGKTSLIKSANTDNFDTTIYFYDGDTLLQSYTLTNEDYEKQIDVDVSGVNQLKILVQDNKAVKRGTSFALYDMFLK